MANRWVRNACFVLITLAVLGIVAVKMGLLGVYLAATVLVFCAKERSDLGLWFIVLYGIAGFATIKTAIWLPSYDVALWRFDAALGFNPRSIMLGYKAMPVVPAIADAVYFALPAAVGITCATSEDANRFFVKQATAAGLAFFNVFGNTCVRSFIFGNVDRRCTSEWNAFYARDLGIDDLV